MIINIILAVPILLFAIVLWAHRHFNYWKKQNVKHLKPLPFFGNYREYILQKCNIGVMVSKICEKFPDEPVIGAYYGTNPVAIIQDPELIKLITTKDFYYFNARELSEYTHKECLTRNMFNTHGDEWRVLRQNLSPIFTSAKMKNIFHLIEKCTRVFEKILDDETTKSNVIEMKSLMARYTMDSITAFAFGVSANSMENKDNNPFRLMGSLIFGENCLYGVKYVFRSVWPSLFYSLGLKLYDTKINVFFRSIILSVIKERNGVPSKRQDVVDQLLLMMKSDYIIGDSIKNFKTGGAEKVKLESSNELLVAQSIILFGAGFYTSSATSTYTLYELAKHPHIQQRVLDEVDAYLSSRDEVGYDCTTELPYLKQCINEALRFYPLSSTLLRQVVEDYTLPNGVKLQRGMEINLPVLHVHRNPKYFKDPEEFRPERFSPEGLKDIVPYSYFPFGAGPRICMGIRFAYMMMLAGLVTVLKKYRVELADDMPKRLGSQDFKAVPKVIQSKFGIRLKLIKRKYWESRMFKDRQT